MDVCKMQIELLNQLIDYGLITYNEIEESYKNY